MANPARSSVNNAAPPTSSHPLPLNPTSVTGGAGGTRGKVTSHGKSASAPVAAAHPHGSPRLHSGRSTRRDVESDEELSSSLVESSDDDATANQVWALVGSSQRTSGANTGTSTAVENPARASPPKLRSVQQSKLVRRARVSQEYFDAHLPNRSPHNAVLRGDLSSLMAILDRDAVAVNARDGKGGTALQLAAQSGQADIVKALLEAGAEVDLRTKNATTALTLAATYGHAAVVSLLLKHGSNQRLVDVAGETPLELAARHGHINVVEALLVQEIAFRKTVPMDPINPFVQSLCLAAQHGHDAIVRALLGAGAPASAFNRKGKNSLMVAVEAGHLNIAAALLPHMPAHAWLADGASIVNLSVKSAGPEHLELLLRHDGTIPKTTPNGTGSEAPASRTYRVLSPGGANGRGLVHPQVSLATTALLAAAAQGKAALVEIALRWGGSLSDVDIKHNTALMAALQATAPVIAMTPTIDMLIESANPARRKLDPAVYNEETLVDRLVSRLSQQDLVIQPRFWLGLTIWLCTERRLRYSVVAPTVAALKQMLEAWPGLSGGLREDSLPVTASQKKALCGHTLATLQGLHTLQNDLGVLGIFSGSPPLAPCYTLGIKKAKSLLEEAKVQSQGLVDLGARTFDRADLSRIAGELAGLAQARRGDIVVALCGNTGMHQVLAEALADAWLDVGQAGQTDVALLRAALWEQVGKPEFLTKCEAQNDLLRGFLMEQMTDLLEHPRT
ncbi:MAG: uncharacterized protein JWR21_1640 [Herminiimonas sp.]|nr:uncharacterized protein [Herminiimonas sp.]MDB5854626.1 uncharacterized protein [Herminiimonas sp.]